jgi:hypothetical protein
LNHQPPSARISSIAVIAREAKQSRLIKEELDCFVASLLAMTTEQKEEYQI